MDPLTMEDAEKAVRKPLSELFALGREDLTKLTVEERADFVKRVGNRAALAIVSMPCVQQAVRICRPFNTPMECYLALLQSIARVFGIPTADLLEPSEEPPAIPPRVN